MSLLNTIAIVAREGFVWVWVTTWQAAVLVGLILLVQRLLRRQLSPGWRYGLWLLFVARLLMPASPQSAFSIFNLAPGARRPSQELAGERDKVKPQARSEETAPVADNRSAANAAGAPPEPGVVSPGGGDGSVLAPAGATPLTVAASPPRGPAPGPDWSRIVWSQVAGLVWLAGVCVLGLRMAWRNFRFWKGLRHHVPVSDRMVTELVDECRVALGVGSRVSVIETTNVDTPAVYGLLCKRLLLPDGAFERFTSGELRYIFLHELSHLKRRDLEINWLSGILQVLHWFNPVVWLAFARMRADRELATDAAALSRTAPSENIAYGETILKVLEEVSAVRRPGLVGIAEDRSHIEQRLRVVAGHPTARHRKWMAAGLVVLVGLVALTDAKKRGWRDVLAAEPPQDTRSFEVRIIDYDTSTPVSGVKVTFESEFYSSPAQTNEVTTGADGRAEIEFETADLKRFAWTADKSGYVCPRGEWLKQQIALLPKREEVKISRGVEIGGTVTDEGGKPLAGAEILFDRPLNMILEESVYPIHSRKWTTRSGERLAVSDATGTWRAKRLYPKIQWASLRVRHPDFTEAIYSTELTKAMEAQGKGMALLFEDLVQQRARFSLRPGVSVNGRVVDETGAPVSAVAVRYSDRRSENPFWDALQGKGTATTDAGGKFQIAHLPQKRIYFTVQATGFAPVVSELDLKSAEPVVEFRLQPGREFEGQVLARDGGPLPGARLTFIDWGIWQGVAWETVTDTEGRFRWRNAPAERFRLRIAKDGFITQEKTARSEREQTFRLDPVLELTGKVLDASSQKPIEAFRLYWTDRKDRFQANRRFSVAGSNGVYSVNVGKLYSDLWSGGYAHEFLIRIEAEGYQPAESQEFVSRNGDVGTIIHDVELRPAQPIAGTVTGPNGAPVAGAQLAFRTPLSRLRLAGKPQFENLDSIVFPVTDRQGRFRLTPDPQATHLVAVHTQGIAWVEAKMLSTNSSVRLQPWGKIEGTAWEYDKPLPNTEIWHDSSMLDNDAVPGFFSLRGTTDEQGRFSFSFVPPGKHRFYRMIPTHRGSSGGPPETVQVQPGQVASVKIGGVGRPVTGRMRIKNPYVEIDWRKDHHMVSSVVPRPPENVKTREAHEAWRQQEDIQRVFDKIRHHPIQFSADGSFRIDEMIPGKYQFNISLYDPRDSDALAHSRYIANYRGEFEVPVTPERDSQTPLSIGEFQMNLKPRLEETKPPAPDFAIRDLQGPEFKLSELRGKFVVLDVWATWCAPCIGDLPYLREVHKKYGQRDDFVLLSLNVDKTIEEPRAFVKKENLPWRQGYVGVAGESELAQRYEVSGLPAILLVDPNGRIIAKDFGADTLTTELGRWLK